MARSSLGFHQELLLHEQTTLRLLLPLNPFNPTNSNKDTALQNHGCSQNSGHWVQTDLPKLDKVVQNTRVSLTWAVHTQGRVWESRMSWRAPSLQLLWLLVIKASVCHVKQLFQHKAKLLRKIQVLQMGCIFFLTALFLFICGFELCFFFFLPISFTLYNYPCYCSWLCEPPS